MTGRCSYPLCCGGCRVYLSGFVLKTTDKHGLADQLLKLFWIGINRCRQVLNGRLVSHPRLKDKCCHMSCHLHCFKSTFHGWISADIQSKSNNASFLIAFCLLEQKTKSGLDHIFKGDMCIHTHTLTHAFLDTVYYIHDNIDNFSGFPPLTFRPMSVSDGV